MVGGGVGQYANNFRGRHSWSPFGSDHSVIVAKYYFVHGDEVLLLLLLFLH